MEQHVAAAAKSEIVPSPTALWAIVSTARFLLLVDLISKRVATIEASRPEYYGVSWFPDDCDLVLSHSRLDSSALVNLASYAQSEVGTLSRGRDMTAGFLSAPHQILCASDGRVICANTGRNAISVFDFGKANCTQDVRVSAARWDRVTLNETAGDHLNSMFERSGCLYVIAHGHANGAKLATFTYPDLRLVEVAPIKGRTGLHNIWVTHDGQKISCDSEAGALIDLSSNRVLWESGCPIYTRGLAASNDFVLVGESEKKPRELRPASLAGLWVLEPHTWKVLDYVCLGPYGAVHEVRLLNVEDHAHHGQVFKGLSKLLVRDDSEALIERKKNASALARRCRLAWEGFDTRFGSPVADSSAARSAGPQDLCLIVQTSSLGKSEWELKFGYALESGPGGSHVSVVTYRGSGGDTDMDALLIYAIDERRATLQIWTQAKGVWSIPFDLESGDLPLAGTIRIRATLSSTEMFVNGQQVVSLTPEQFPWTRGQFGIRWLGATIYPPNSLGEVDCGIPSAAKV